ncbi:MAG TPA: SDR family oxidoreductase [Acidimicrobiales bacterium]|nr:SDR family oxidoreductase [Acidimicrobiales bacterium]
MSRPTVLITGASSGIGLAFARSLAADGQGLVLVARREGRLKEIADELAAAHGVAAEALVADLTDAEDLARVEARVAERDRPVDLLVNNAGFGTLGRFATLPIEDEEREIRLNVVALVRLTRAALGAMTARGRGGIINVSSVASFQAGPYNATYAATKAFVTSFTEAVGEELRGTGVRVMALCPGFTRTEFQEAANAEATSVPSLLWQDAQAVVDTALRDLRRGTAISIPGIHNKMAAVLSQLAPRSLTRRVSGLAGRRLQR